MFRYKLRQLLLPFELMMGGRGHEGDAKCLTPQDAKNRQHARSMAALRARHETVNRMSKTFDALKQLFRHDPNLHHLFFRFVAVLIQLGHQSGHSHHDVIGYVDPAFEADW